MLNVNEIVLGFMAAVLVIIVFAMLHSANRYKQQTAIRRALIEKFGSAQDLGEFLRTPDGQRFVSDLFSAADTPVRSVLASVHKGILILALGASLIAVGIKSEEEAIYVGGVLVALGLGFLISAAITRRLSEKWGLAEPPAPRHPARAI